MRVGMLARLLVVPDTWAGEKCDYGKEPHATTANGRKTVPVMKSKYKLWQQFQHSFLSILLHIHHARSTLISIINLTIILTVDQTE